MESTADRGTTQRRVQAVVFDFGGVLITPITNQISEVATASGVDDHVMHELLLGPRASGPDHPWHRAERGEIAVTDIQDLLGPWAEQVGVALRGDEIDRLLVAGGYSVDATMVARVESLGREGFKTALLTNTFAEFRPTMERDIDLTAFDAVIESFAVGARKPEPAIYETAAQLLGVAHDEIVYLDDFDQNLVPAQALGWTTIHVGERDAALLELDRLVSPR